MTIYDCNYENIYEVIRKLGEGGNAQVLHVRNRESNKECALKILKVKNDEKKHRFKEEIKIIKNHVEINGILPIYDYSFKDFWYTMPIAKPIFNHIIDTKIKINELILGVIQLSETLEKLHENNISHRDIKPSNLYFYKEKFCIGDFGLASFPKNENSFTKSDRGVGAIFTIAPEMKRNPKIVDGKKADVYSLAKTMWMLMTKNEKGFDGVYNFQDPSIGLHFFDDYKNVHLVEIEDLLLDSTNNNPNFRPTMKEFKERLQQWHEIIFNENKSQASDWNFLNKQLFGLYPPDSSSWKKIEKIINILNTVASTPAYNHMLSHTGGGLDFLYAKKASENNCIKLYNTTGTCYIVKPERLYFEGFVDNFKWNYFILELDKLEPVFESNRFDYEYLVEDVPGNYVSAQYAQYGVYDYEKGVPFPKGAETVCRYTKGRLLIVMKNGPYNRINGTYDGRHGDCSIDEFRKYIQELISQYLNLDYYIKQKKYIEKLSEEEIEEKILQLEYFNKNPFKKKSKYTDDLEVIKNKKNSEESEKFICDNFLNFNFSKIMSKYKVSNNTNIKFVFKFYEPSNSDIFEILNDYQYFLCRDGYIRKINLSINSEYYFLNDRNLAISMQRVLMKEVNNILKQKNLKDLMENELLFSILLMKNRDQQHLFTKEEIKKAMKEADDRVHNQLVIDENGYAKVIKEERYGHLYPVSHEPWDAGNMYVGKYSKLLSLEDCYISSLQGWLSYLKCGKHQYIDCVQDNKCVEQLLKEIAKYYK